MIRETEASGEKPTVVALDVDGHRPVARACLVPALTIAAILRDGEVVAVRQGEDVTAEDLRSFVARNL